MFFNIFLGRRMAAAEDEEAVGGDAAAEKGDAARGDGYDDVDEASNGSTDSAVRVEDVLRQLTEAEQKEEDDALQASFSGISEEDRLVLMQFLPQLELLKDDKNAKDLAEKDSPTNTNPPPTFTNGFSEQEPSLPRFTNGFAEQEPSLIKQAQPTSTNDLPEPEPTPEAEPLPHVAAHLTAREDSPESEPQPPSSDSIPLLSEPTPEAEPLPHVAAHLTAREDSPEAEPQPPSSDSIPLLSHESKLELRQERKSEDSDKLDKIMKELKSIRRQQTITHCLVTVLIVVTAVWQYSEASIALSVKDKLTHPFRAIGGFFSRALLGGEKLQILDKVPSPPEIPPLEVSQLAHIKLPELPHPHVDLPSTGIQSIES